MEGSNLSKTWRELKEEESNSDISDIDSEDVLNNEDSLPIVINASDESGILSFGNQHIACKNESSEDSDVDVIEPSFSDLQRDTKPKTSKSSKKFESNEYGSSDSNDYTDNDSIIVVTKHKKKILIVDSESEDDKSSIYKSVSDLKLLVKPDNTLDISKVSETPKTEMFLSENIKLINTNYECEASEIINLSSPVNIEQNKLKTNIADRIKAEQLLAEKKRLSLQICKVNEEVANSKLILRTANLSALPDKGMRLEVTLARQESNLKDLLVQEKIVDEKLSNMSSDLINYVKNIKEESQNVVTNVPLWSNVASTSQNINEMGRKALETHRVQQALTMDTLQKLHASLQLCPSENVEADDPADLSVSLMPHQKHALAWLLWRETQTPSGGILADDMGLGKTLTMISLIIKSEENKSKFAKGNSDSSSDDEDKDWLSTSKKKKYKGNTLVVCPASLIGQWEGEVISKVKHNKLSIEMYHGPKREKKERRLCRRDIVITTYTIVNKEYVRPDNKHHSPNGPLLNICWKRIILDEAHQIRNFKSKTALKIFELRGKHRWVLTGTPIHNKESDLYALIKFLRCSPFDDYAVWKKWVDNRDASGNQRLSTMVKALMLRRTKEDLKQKGALTNLKDKSFSIIEVKLTKEESELYQKLLDFSVTLLAQFIEQKAEKENYSGHVFVNRKKKLVNQNDGNEDPFANHPDLSKLYSRMKNLNEVKTTDILVLLLRLRQICCHPTLITAMLVKEEMKDVGIENNDGLDLELLEKMGNMSIVFDAEKEGSNSPTSPLNYKNPIFSADVMSSKIKNVIKTIEENILPSEDKGIVVSQWTSMLDLIYNVLCSKKIKCVLLTGSVPVKDRGDIVKRFNEKNKGPKTKHCLVS
uniref:Transcription termination factor 2 n=1 Tax=Clastoptera arizonana TaxID=38151 RepID=A0A1B6E4Y1_9HEMI